MNIQRCLDLKAVLRHKSCFLFGPRQTGKSFLIRHQLKAFKTYNLLERDVFLQLSRSSRRLKEESLSADKIIIIDEIQKIPQLLDEVHLLIEEKKIHFLLTGSSARKLKRSGTNLLGGRARVRYLYPLSSVELKQQFDLNQALNRGLLPAIYFSSAYQDDLRDYIGTYLMEEIAAEGFVRNVPSFSRFLEVAALSNGKMLNYVNIANDAQVARTTIQEYFQILYDTLIGYEVSAWTRSVKRKAIGASKFYFFDTGVLRSLCQRVQWAPGTPEYGEAFETFILHELYVWGSLQPTVKIKYWRSQAGHEVDFILDNNIAIEVKASRTIGTQDLKGLKALKEEGLLAQYVLVCLEDVPRKVDGIHILPWRVFIQLLWDQKLKKL